MGLNAETLDFILSVRPPGFGPKKVLTLGRQNLYLSNSELADRCLGVAREGSVYSSSRYADAVWKELYGDEVQSMDASDYEGADLIFDLNDPYPKNLSEFFGKFDLILDLGTLEHIYDFTQALHNCSQMLSPEGVFISETPLNGHAGHGFWQPGPEVFWQCPSLHVTDMLAVERGWRIKKYRVERARGRAIWSGGAPATLLVAAKRTAPRVGTPNQSDYVDLWAESTRPVKTARDAWKSALLETLPGPMRMLERIAGSRTRRSEHYTRIR